MGLRIPRGSFWVDRENDCISLVIPATEGYPAVAYSVRTDGIRLRFIKPGQMCIPSQNIFNNEVYSAKNTDAKDFFIIRMQNINDTLYHYDAAADEIQPKFTADCGNPLLYIPISNCPVIICF